MKVLKIIHTMGHGGAENVFRWLAFGLMHKGIDVVAGITPFNADLDKEDWITPALDEVGVRHLTFGKDGGRMRLIRSIKGLIERVRPDLVHSHLMDSNFYSSIACRMLSVPHVCTEHGDISLRDSVSMRMKLSLTSLLSDSMVCVSEDLRRKVEAKSIFRGRLNVIYNGMDFPAVEVSGFRREFSIPEDALLIGNVANIYPVKGQKYLVEAFSRFNREFPGSYLAIVGRGDERKGLEELTRRLGIPGDRVIFTGFRSDVADIIASLDVYVQPSLSEGLPVALIEVLSSGVPVIATNVGGVAEIARGMGSAVLVSPRSAEEICRAMHKVVGNLREYRKMASESKSGFRKKFSLETMTRNYIEEYERVLKERGRAL